MEQYRSEAEKAELETKKAKAEQEAAKAMEVKAAQAQYARKPAVLSQAQQAEKAAKAQYAGETVVPVVPVVPVTPPVPVVPVRAGQPWPAEKVSSHLSDLEQCKVWLRLALAEEKGTEGEWRLLRRTVNDWFVSKGDAALS